MFSPYNVDCKVQTTLCPQLTSTGSSYCSRALHAPYFCTEVPSISRALALFSELPGPCGWVGCVARLADELRMDYLGHLWAGVFSGADASASMSFLHPSAGSIS